eukprot:gnl/TRDRNA2_/TRDRNA2_180394_c0_seq1.p1 gnl/TRDRNA2_/TRDRNA2_180394_c0~~gnl/TRDRNA2_/TRDRNA2_180394_c0_seq1.p1  ORF type:complete len:211 (+),score=29.51 gnl/TRDRNA2_/TRDRNA2_180394_c0_seq1:143-775(+)
MAPPAMATPAAAAPVPLCVRLQPVFVTLLAAQAVLVVARFATGDGWGAATMLVVTALGALAIPARGDSVDALFALFYGSAVLILGMFDLTGVFERITMLKITYGGGHEGQLFGPTLSTRHNLISGLVILYPILELSMTMICFALFNDAAERFETAFVMSQQRVPLSSRTRQSATYAATATTGGAPNVPKAFQGEGKKLSDWLPEPQLTVV